MDLYYIIRFEWEIFVGNVPNPIYRLAGQEAAERLASNLQRIAGGFVDESGLEKQDDEEFKAVARSTLPNEDALAFDQQIAELERKATAGDASEDDVKLFVACQKWTRARIGEVRDESIRFVPTGGASVLAQDNTPVRTAAAMNLARADADELAARGRRKSRPEPVLAADENGNAVRFAPTGEVWLLPETDGWQRLYRQSDGRWWRMRWRHDDYCPHHPCVWQVSFAEASSWLVSNGFDVPDDVLAWIPIAGTHAGQSAGDASVMEQDKMPVNAQAEVPATAGNDADDPADSDPAGGVSVVEQVKTPWDGEVGAPAKRGKRAGRLRKMESSTKCTKMLALVRQHPSLKDDLAKLARDVGVSESTVRRWLDHEDQAYLDSKAANAERPED